LETIQIYINRYFRRVKSNPKLLTPFLIAMAPIVYFGFFVRSETEASTPDGLIDKYEDGVWYQEVGSLFDNNDSSYSEKQLTITVDGEQNTISTNQTNLRSAFREAGLVLGDFDIVEPIADSPIWKEMEVKITRVEKAIDKVEYGIDYEIVYQDNPDELIGYEVVQQAGQEGVDEHVIEKTFNDGVLVSEETLEVNRLKEPVNQIIERGTQAIVLQTYDGRATWYRHPRYLGELIAASDLHPKGSMLRVTNTNNGYSVLVRVVDCCLSHNNPLVVVDLSLTAFNAIASLGAGEGILPIKVELLASE